MAQLQSLHVTLVTLKLGGIQTPVVLNVRSPATDDVTKGDNPLI